MKSEATKRLINIRWTLFGAVTISVICAGFFIVSSVARAALVTKTWDGGGATNNWSEPANWSGDTVPVAGDKVVFDGTSVKNASLDTNVNLGSIFIAGAYTGTITQSNAASIQISGCSGGACFQQNGGTFNGSSNTITMTTPGFGAIEMNGGTFNGGSGDITLAGDGIQLNLQGGTFTSTSGNLACAGSFRFLGTSVFNHNNGTVTIAVTNIQQTIVADRVVTFNNLIFNNANGVDFEIFSRVAVAGNLSLDDGSLGPTGAVIEAHGTVSTSPNFDGGSLSIEYSAGGSPRTITLETGRNHPNIILNDPNLTVNTSGGGTLVLPHQLIIRQGTFNQGNVDLSITQNSGQNISQGSCLEISGGIFNGSSHLLTLTADGFSSVFMTGGSFNGGSGDIIATGPGGNIQVTAASFKSTSGTLFAGKSLRMQSNSGFNPNGGTVVFDEGPDGGFTFIAILADNPQGALVDIAFNNVVINKTSGTTILLGVDHMFVNGSLTLNDGQVDAAGSANINAFANVNIGSGFDGFTNRVKLNFSGFACQTVTISTTQNFANDWIVDKPSCGMTAVGNFGVHSIFIPNGSLTLANGAVNASGDLTIGIGGVLTLGSSTVISAGNGQIGGTVDLSGADGSLIINANANVTSSGVIELSGLNDTVNLNSLTIDPGGQFIADHAETITLGGNVVNNGLINLYASGSECAVGTFMVLQSSVPGTTRNWSGNGVFRMVHVNVVDQGGTAPIRVHDGVASGTTIANANWTFDSNCRASALHTPFDFDGDGKSDLSVFRPSSAEWFAFRSTSSVIDQQFGISTDKTVSADFDGDGMSEIAVYRPSEGNWYILRSSDGIVQVVNWGVNNDKPVLGDYDGDGKADITQYRPSEGNWYILKSSDGQVLIINWGEANDIPLYGDFDGDNKGDQAIYRPSTGQWFVYRSTQGPLVASWGIAGDKPVVGDFDGDGKADLSVYRPSEGNWYAFRSSDSVPSIVHWGEATDIPLAGDYDGDGKSDQAVYRNGTWLINRSTAGPLIANWGIQADLPIPGVYVP